jgi:hypothetical protein
MPVSALIMVVCAVHLVLGVAGFVWLRVRRW